MERRLGQSMLEVCTLKSLPRMTSELFLKQKKPKLMVSNVGISNNYYVPWYNPLLSIVNKEYSEKRRSPKLIDLRWRSTFYRF